MKIKVLLSLLVLFIVSACADLEVENPNDPDTSRVLGTPGDLINVVKAGANSWYSTATAFGFYMTTSVMADAHTSSWGNAGMRDMGNEPRKAWDNGVQYNYAGENTEQYNGYYSVINQVNDILEVLDNGDQDLLNTLGDDVARIRAFGHLLLGLSYGYLGLIYDQVVVIRPGEEVTAETFTFTPYQDVLAYALENLDLAITTANSASSLSYPNWFNGVSMDKTLFLEMANTYAAKLLIWGSRNKAQNDAVDWNRVLAYAENGFTNDFVITNDADVWIAWGQAYSNRPGWVRVDLRILNMMDPNYPSTFPADQTSLDPATSADARLESDFEYNSTVPFRANRGLYHYSNYRYSRLDPLPTDLQGPAPDTYAAEVDLMQAEAHLRLGRKADAIAIINAGTRVTRGQLDPIADDAADDVVMSAIFYEREIELFASGAMMPWFDMRRRDLLQMGTPLHFPVPGRELETLQLDSYTFGGQSAADGINASNGGWK